MFKGVNWRLLQWEYQPEKRSRSWLMTIRVQRRETQELLEENPSLKPYLEEVLPKIYESSGNLAVGETNLPRKTFPENYLYPLTLEEIFRDGWYPGELATDDLRE